LQIIFLRRCTDSQVINIKTVLKTGEIAKKEKEKLAEYKKVRTFAPF